MLHLIQKLFLHVHVIYGTKIYIYYVIQKILHFKIFLLIPIKYTHFYIIYFILISFKGFIIVIMYLLSFSICDVVFAKCTFKFKEALH